MFFIIREVVGWILVIAALALIPTVLGYVSGVGADGSRKVIEAGIVAFIASLLMRSGIHLVRVSTAARLATAKHSE